MSRFWSIEKAQGAVKSAYFSREILAPAAASDLWLRYSEIKRAIGFDQGSIGDRTLSRTLNSLVAAGQLTKRTAGRKTQYRLVISRADRLRAFARAEAAGIESASTVGGRGNGLEGWAVFGLPEFVPRKYVSRLRAACRAHREALQGVLEDVCEDAIDAVLTPARRGVSRKSFVAGKKAARGILEYQLLGAYGLAYSARVWGTIEKLVPGTLRAFQKNLSPGSPTVDAIPDTITAVAARLSGRNPEVLRPEVDAGIRKVHRRLVRLSKDFKPLWDALTPREQERAGQRLRAATEMTAALTSIVHA